MTEIYIKGGVREVDLACLQMPDCMCDERKRYCRDSLTSESLHAIDADRAGSSFPRAQTC